MFSLPSLRIGKYFGIPVEVNISWLAIFVLIAFQLARDYFPAIGAYQAAGPWARAVAGVVTALLFFVSILAHEFSHSLVARMLGIPIERVTLFLFGGVSQMNEEPQRPRDEFFMAVAGPAMSVVLAAAFALAWMGLYAAGVSELWWAPLQYLSVVNVAVAIFNMLPGFPLDGGRVLRAALWGATHDLLKATRWACRAGQVWGWAFAAAGAAIIVLARDYGGLWWILIGWFLITIAGASYRQAVMTSQLGSIAVDTVASRPAVVVPGEATVEQVVVRHIIEGEHSKYPVASQGQLIGIMSLADAKAVPRAEWPFTQASQLARGDISQIVITYSASLEEALHRLEPDHPGMLVVERDGMLDGVLTRHDIVQELRRLSMAKPPA